MNRLKQNQTVKCIYNLALLDMIEHECSYDCNLYKPIVLLSLKIYIRSTIWEPYSMVVEKFRKSHLNRSVERVKCEPKSLGRSILATASLGPPTGVRQILHSNR